MDHLIHILNKRVDKKFKDENSVKKLIHILFLRGLLC